MDNIVCEYCDKTFENTDLHYKHLKECKYKIMKDDIFLLYKIFGGINERHKELLEKIENIESVQKKLMSIVLANEYIDHIYNLNKNNKNSESDEYSESDKE